MGIEWRQRVCLTSSQVKPLRRIQSSVSRAIDKENIIMMSSLKSCAWYAVQVKGRQEIQVSRALQSKGYKTFVPLYKTRKTWSDRDKIVEAPLFPNYMFCRFD